MPTMTTVRPAPAALRLPPVRARAARRLRNRKTFVPVAETTDATEPAAASAMTFISRVAAMLVHTVFFFPGLGLQAMIYMAWLLDRTGSSPVAEAQRVDARVCQAMALSPRELSRTWSNSSGGGGPRGGPQRRGPFPTTAIRCAGATSRDCAGLPVLTAGCTRCRRQVADEGSRRARH